MDMLLVLVSKQIEWKELSLFQEENLPFPF